MSKALRIVVALAAVGLAIGGCRTASSSDVDADEDYSERMSAEHENDKPVATPQSSKRPERPIHTGDVIYARIDGKEVRGYSARPAWIRAPVPGVIVIHEWWGLNDNVRAMADQLAAAGYAALAVDLYNGEAAVDRDGARALMQRAMADPDVAEENLRQAHAHLRSTRAQRIGTIGWCFGGGWSLRSAMMMPSDIDATVIYYGRLVTDKEKLEPLETPILGIFGSEDRGIPMESVRAFESALNDLGKDAAIHVYDGADHAFANPSGTRYQKDAAEDAWQKTLAFFKEHLGGPGVSR